MGESEKDGTPAAGKFRVVSNGQSVNVEYQNGVISDGNGHTLDVVVSGDNTVPIQNGEGILYVGATLSVPQGVPAGNYSSSNVGGTPYRVTVAY